MHHRDIEIKHENTHASFNEDTASFTVNYHKHPEVGGTGHISIEARRNNETVELSVYPNPSPIHLPFAIASFYIIPSPAIHHPINQNQEGHSPIAESYHIPSENIPYPNEAFEKLKEIRNSVDSGNTGFSLARNFLTEAIHMILSPKVSAANIHIGNRVLDRDIIDKEKAKVTLTNCADSAAEILEAGGIKIPDSARILSHPTPAGISQHLRAHGFHKNNNQDNGFKKHVKKIPENTVKSTTLSMHISEE
jgi:hypothetical protein